MKVQCFLLFTLLILTESCVLSRKNANVPKQESELNCAKRILALDNSLGDIRNHACESNTISYAITAYLNGLDKLDYSRCSKSFHAAFLNHARAWRDMQKFTDKYPEERGEMHDVFSRIEKGRDSLEYKNLLGEIWSTWEQVEQSSKISKPD